MRRLWLTLGLALGALIVWALTHDDRRMANKWREQRESMRPLGKLAQRRLAERSAIKGKDLLSDEYWDNEMEQYREWVEAVKRGDPDADELIK